MLFQEQGITIASILMPIGMTISILIEALLPASGGAAGVVSLCLKTKRVLRNGSRTN